MKNKIITEKQLWRIWKCINELQEYLGNSIEQGAQGANKDYNEAKKCKALIKRARLKLAKNQLTNG